MEQYLIDRLSPDSDEELEIRSGETLNKKLYSASNSFIINEARLFGKNGTDIGVRTHTRYIDFPEHRHNYIEMMIVLRGCIKHTVGSETVELGEGEILILNKHMPHSIERSQKNDVAVNIIMSDRFISSMNAELSGTLFSPFINENGKADGEPMYLCFSTGGKKHIENVIENLLIELISGDKDTSIVTKTVSLLLTYLSIGKGELLKCGSLPGDKDSRRRLDIISYIKNNYRSASLTELGEKLYLTPPYLSKFIKESFGRNFKELVVEERMERAKHLINTTTLPIGDIIRSVGYENESYFHKEFKKKYSITPLSMRGLKF